MSLEEVVATDEESGGEISLFHDVLSDGQEDPGTKAARKMDWDLFWQGLSRRERAIIEGLVQGKTFREVGHKCKTSYSTINNSKRDLATKLLDFMGPDILIEVRRLPQWKQDIETTRSKMACREERRHL